MEIRYWLIGYFLGLFRKMLFYFDCYKCIFIMEKKNFIKCQKVFFEDGINVKKSLRDGQGCKAINYFGIRFGVKDKGKQKDF